jgi:hypothetical protein
MADKDITEKAEQLVTKAESGDKSGLTEELNNMTIEDRLAVAREMDRLNDDHRKSNPSLPDIELTTNSDAAGREHLQDIQANTRTERSYLNPARWFGDTHSSSRQDVYDPPKGELGNGLLQQAADGILSRKAQMDEIEKWK